jgi:hypothetical protein
MKRTALLVIGILAISASAFAQGRGRGRGPAPAMPLEPGATQAEVDTAVMALPANLRNGAEVIKWSPDHTYKVLRKGSNNLVCYDRSGFPLQAPFSIECTNVGNLDRVAQNMAAEATGTREKSEAMLKEEEAAGKRIKPVYGSVWYHLMGQSKDNARTHVTIAIPGATTQSTGLPDKPGQGTVWIMDAGTSTAHIMTPGE